MNEKFQDIFESIHNLHRKYKSTQYISNLDELNKSSKDIQKILEKCKVESK